MIDRSAWRHVACRNPVSLDAAPRIIQGTSRQAMCPSRGGIERPQMVTVGACAGSGCSVSGANVGRRRRLHYVAGCKGCLRSRVAEKGDIAGFGGTRSGERVRFSGAAAAHR